MTIHSLSRLAAERIREILLAATRDKNVLLGKSTRLTSTSSRASSRSPLPTKPSFVLPSFLDPLRNLRTRHSLPCPLRSGRSNTHRPLEEPSSLHAKKHPNQHRHSRLALLVPRAAGVDRLVSLALLALPEPRGLQALFHNRLNRHRGLPLKRPF